MRSNKGLLMTVFLAGMIGLITFGYAILQNDGFFTLAADFNHQQIPFSAAAWEGIHSGSSWLWGVDLGSSLITAFSFYNLGSPFFWVTLLFPKDAFPWLVGILFILKYMTAAGTGYGYLRRFCGKDAAMIGGLVYAFSGFQATNLMFYHFHDVVAFFPLLLMGLEDYLREKKKTGFIFAVFLNCLVNCFFFLQEVIFLIIYFLFREWKEQSIRKTVRKAWNCLLCGFWGVGMAAILLLPSLIYTFRSEREGIPFSFSAFLYQPADFLRILKGILLPAETMDWMSSLTPYDFGSANGYVPLFGAAFALAYVLRKRDWLGRLLLFLTVLSLFPYGNGLFVLFQETYQRWWYMWTMMAALASALVAENPRDYPVKKALWIYLALLLLFAGGTWLSARNPDSGISIYDIQRFGILSGVAAAGTVLLIWIRHSGQGKRVLLPAVCIFCSVTTAITLYSYRAHEWSPPDLKIKYQAGMRLRNPDDQYRFDSTENLLMMTGNTGGYGAFISTAENESYRFSKLTADYFPSHTDGVWRAFPYLPQLLGAKYKVSEAGDAESAVDSFEMEGNAFYVSEGEACPIGFAVDSWITEEDLLSIPVEKRAVVLMNAFAIREQDLDWLRDENTPRMSAAEYAEPDPEESIRRTAENAVSGFVRDGKGFACSTNWERDRFVYFTVPYDAGWHAAIDGEDSQILNSGGMMVLRVPSGEHRIAFSYHTPGFREGTMISLLSGLAFAVYACFIRWNRKKRDAVREELHRIEERTFPVEKESGAEGG